jgi:hypothetical protein
LKDPTALVKKKWSGRRGDLRYPEQKVRSLVARRNMTDADTERIADATIRGQAGSRYYMHLARPIGTQNLSLEESPVQSNKKGKLSLKKVPKKVHANQVFSLKNKNVSRDHILADSNVRNIVTEIYKFMKKSGAEKIPMSVARFVHAMTAGDGYKSVIQRMKIDFSRKGQANFAGVADELSHGRGNLFFGDARVNGNILHGLDVPLERGRPTRAAAKIMDATNGLGHEEVVPREMIFDALSPTGSASTGLALSSSGGPFHPSHRFNTPSRRPPLGSTGRPRSLSMSDLAGAEGEGAARLAIFFLA